jgi:hypothetical protein
MSRDLYYSSDFVLICRWSQEGGLLIPELGIGSIATDNLPALLALQLASSAVDNESHKMFKYEFNNAL